MNDSSYDPYLQDIFQMKAISEWSESKALDGLITQDIISTVNYD